MRELAVFLIALAVLLKVSPVVRWCGQAVRLAWWLIGKEP